MVRTLLLMLIPVMLCAGEVMTENYYHLTESSWLVHNGKVCVRFEGANATMQAVVNWVAPDFKKAALGDTIIRSARFTDSTGVLTDGTIAMGALKARFSADIRNDSTLAVQIQILLIKQQHEWKKSQLPNITKNKRRL